MIPQPIWILSAIFLLLSWPLPDECLGPTSGNVQLKFVFALNGDDLGQGDIVLFKSVDTGHDYAKGFQGNFARNLPPGTYHLRAHVSGFWSVDRLVAVRGPEVWVVLGAHLGMCTAVDNANLSVSVRGLPATPEPIWARLSSIRASTVLDAPVSATGFFSIRGISADDYVLAIWSGERVLYAGHVKIPTPESKLIIEIPQKGLPPTTNPKD